MKSKSHYSDEINVDNNTLLNSYKCLPTGKQFSKTSAIL